MNTFYITQSKLQYIKAINDLSSFIIKNKWAIKHIRLKKYIYFFQ